MQLNIRESAMHMVSLQNILHKCMGKVKEVYFLMISKKVKEEIREKSKSSVAGSQ